MDHTRTAAKDRQPPAPPPRKYISMFRIDGVPILPPLMTAEKRRQMQKIKEKAIKLEHKFEEKRQKKLQFRENLEEVLGETHHQQTDTPRSQRSIIRSSSSGSVSGSISQQSYDLETAAVKQQQQLEQESYKLLSTLVQNPEEAHTQNGGGVRAADSSSVSNTKHVEEQHPQRNFKERMQKLQKSRTIIYDNNSNTIITPTPEKVPTQPLPAPCDKPKLNATYYSDTDEDVYAEYIAAQKPSHLPLNVTTKIPSIYVNPPTPLMDSRSFCEKPSTPGHESSPPNNHSITSIDDESSEDSYRSSLSSLRHGNELRSQTKCSNIPAKMNSSKSLNLSNIKPPQRSATSPQLKPSNVKRSPSNALGVSNDMPATNALVRSNSFTLDCPSKALLDHIRKQNAGSDTSSQKRTTPSASATRDTVESKAKRVQKVLLKSRPAVTSARSKTKVTTSTSSNSLYLNSSNSSYNLTKSNHNNNNNKVVKRSPYDSKFNTKPKSSYHLSKSNSATTTPKQMQAKSSMPTLTGAYRSKECQMNQELLNDFEMEHHQKFLKLIAQQKEEQKRLQETFEAQQQQLLKELTAEMSRSHIQQLRSPGTPTSGSSMQLSTPLKGAVERNCISHIDHLAVVAVDTSVTVNSDVTGIQSPSLSMVSSILTPSMNATSAELHSLDTSTSSTLTSAAVMSSNRCTPRRRLFTRDNITSALTTTVGGIGSGANGGGDAAIISPSSNASTSANRRCNN